MQSCFILKRRVWSPFSICFHEGLWNSPNFTPFQAPPTSSIFNTIWQRQVFLPVGKVQSGCWREPLRERMEPGPLSRLITNSWELTLVRGGRGSGWLEGPRLSYIFPFREDSVFGFQQFYYDVPRWDFLCIYPSWVSWCFYNLWNIFSHYLFPHSHSSLFLGP